MPKKMGINSKSAEALARKEEKKQADQERSDRDKEDSLWKEDDKHVLRKLNRKDEKEKKKSETSERKAELRAIYESEMGAAAQKEKDRAEVKLSRAQISANLEQKPKEKKQDNPGSRQAVAEPIEENLNRLMIEGEVASTVDDAIAVLGCPEKIDRHPEKRMKAAYAAFEELHLPTLKTENPNLRLSQLKQMIKKDWLKSPDNPLNAAQN